MEGGVERVSEYERILMMTWGSEQKECRDRRPQSGLQIRKQDGT